MCAAVLKSAIERPRMGGAIVKPAGTERRLQFLLKVLITLSQAATKGHVSLCHSAGASCPLYHVVPCCVLGARAARRFPQEQSRPRRKGRDSGLWQSRRPRYSAARSLLRARQEAVDDFPWSIDTHGRDMLYEAMFGLDLRSLLFSSFFSRNKLYSPGCGSVGESHQHERFCFDVSRK